MTLLRNDLRSEDKNRPQSGWLDNIITKKPKEVGEAEPAKPRPAREAMIPGFPSDDDGPDLKKKAQPVVAAAAAAPAPVRTPAPSPVRAERPMPPAEHPQATVPTTEPQAQSKVPIPAVAYAVVFVLTAALASLQGKESWMGVLILVTVGLLAASILAVWHRDGSKKAFWQGFAVFGFGYLFMAFVPTFPTEAGVELPTSRLIKVIHSKVTGTPEDPRASFAIMKGISAPASTEPELFTPEASKTETASFLTPGSLHQYIVVGQCGFTLVFALIGSFLARGFRQGTVLG